MLDDRIRAVLARLEQEDAAERARGLPAAERARQVEPTTGRFLFSLVAPQADCEVLEIGGSRGGLTSSVAPRGPPPRGPGLSLAPEPPQTTAGGAHPPAAGGR